MAYEMKPGQGSAFKNKDKTEDWHPAYRGKVMLPNGVVHYLDITPKKTQAGEPWVSVKIGREVAGRPVDAHNQAKGNGYQPQPVDDDQSIPF